MRNSKSTRQYQSQSLAFCALLVLTACLPTPEATKALPCRSGSGFWSLLVVGNAPVRFHASTPRVLVAYNVQQQGGIAIVRNRDDANLYLLVAWAFEVRPYTPTPKAWLLNQPRYWDTVTGCEYQSGRTQGWAAVCILFKRDGHAIWEPIDMSTINEGTTHASLPYSLSLSLL